MKRIEIQLHSDAAKTIWKAVKKQFSKNDLDAYAELIASYCNELAAYQRLQGTFDPTDYKQMMSSKMQFEKVCKLATALELTPKANKKKRNDTGPAIEMP